MTSPDIWAQAVEDGVSAEGFNPITDALAVWLLVKLNGAIIGVILINHESSCSINIHPVLYGKYKRHARDMMISFFKWIDSMPDKIAKVNCMIPNHLKIVQNAALKVGFKKEGVNRSSYLKDGIIHDQVRFGLTRKEIKDLL